MIEKEGNQGTEKNLLWMARIFGGLWAFIGFLFLIAFFLEEIDKNAGHFPVPDDILKLVILVVVFIALTGLIVAYWREVVGALISLGSFALAGILILVDHNLHFNLFIFIIALFPSMMYLFYWWLSKKSTEQ